MTTHIPGILLGAAALALLLIRTVPGGEVLNITACIVYALSIAAVFTVSSVYHGLKPTLGKKVMQVLDHCTIYFLIAGTYTPVALCAIRPQFPVWGWLIFGFVWGDTPLQELLQQINPDDEEVKAFFKEDSVKKELKKNRKIRRLITNNFGKKYLSNIWK